MRNQRINFAQDVQRNIRYSLNWKNKCTGDFFLNANFFDGNYLPSFGILLVGN